MLEIQQGQITVQGRRERPYLNAALEGYSWEGRPNYGNTNATGNQFTDRICGPRVIAKFAIDASLEKNLIYAVSVN
jgi:hypothetical protein